MATSRAAKLSGALLLTAGAAILMGIITAEALFPVPYSTSRDTISGLGSTWNPGGVVRQPSAAIFNTTMAVTGMMIAAAAVALYVSSRRIALSTALGTLGVGVLLVGILPGEELDGQPVTSGTHAIVAMLAFLAGAAAALLAVGVVRGPFRYASALAGLLVLLALALQGPLEGAGLGEGGVERWVAYPTVLWLVAFGGYLLAVETGDLRRRARPSRPGRA